jgi:glycerol transport system ATP-binding protein
MPLAGRLAGLPAGMYRFGIRANHLLLRQQHPSDIAIPAEVDLAEISGSETFVHVRHNNLDWVVQEDGVHNIARGAAITVYLNPAQLYVFGDTGALEIAPRSLSLDDAA